MISGGGGYPSPCTSAGGGGMNRWSVSRRVPCSTPLIVCTSLPSGKVRVMCSFPWTSMHDIRVIYNRRIY